MEAKAVKEESVDEIARKGMLLIRSGRIRNHKLGCSSRIYTGEMEKKECQNYRDFLSGRNGCMVFELTGNECYE